MKINLEKKFFYIFLFISTIAMTLVQLLRNVIYIDAIEAIVWGNLISFGTNKHPPFSGWIAGLVHNIFGYSDLAFYFLGQICVIIGLIFVYKLAKFFLSEEKAICCAIILQACYYYTFYIFENTFNCNIVLMAFWPIITYYFYKSIKFNKITDWLIFGITSGLGFLGKYQIVFLFLGLFLYLILVDRKQFKSKGLYLSILAGFTIIIPHIVWLFKTDFFSFAYMIERTETQTHNMPILLQHLKRLIYPAKFILDQILAVLPCVLIYIFAGKKIDYSNNKNNFSNKLFLICVGVIPIVAHALMGFITSSRVPGAWGSIMVSFVGILLFYFLPIKFDEKTFKNFVKWAYASLAVSIGAICVFFVFQTKLAINFPYQKICSDLNKIWKEQTNNSKLKYVGGEIGFVFQFGYYNPEKPAIILETFGHTNPWADQNDITKSGALIFAKEAKDLDYTARELLPSLPKDYKVIPNLYSYEICNKFNKCKNYEIYYTIVKNI